jgi:hypothetical protein
MQCERTLKSESEVKAVAAVSLFPSAEYIMKVASVTKIGTAVKKKPITPPRSRLLRTCRAEGEEKWRGSRGDEAGGKGFQRQAQQAAQAKLSSHGSHACGRGCAV